MGFRMGARERARIREALERLRSEINSMTEETVETIGEFRQLIRDFTPKPLRRMIRTKVDRIFGRRKRWGE